MHGERLGLLTRIRARRTAKNWTHDLRADKGVTASRSARTKWKVPERTGGLADVVRRDFGNGEMRDNTNFKNALALACESGFY
jgi:hypothetical protein